ncbi:MAG: hypothetical protein LBK47_03125 [Prevotellaceae bacterium]|jgi:hypothetical protein|nr:hypothetical protein [Prevotellaceae bacterium]
MPRTILVFIIALLCFSCERNEIETPSLPLRTVLVYMAADNNLYANAEEDINEMLAAGVPGNCNLIVYLDTKNSYPQLLKIQNGKSTEVKKYERQNSASGEVLHTVIQDATSMFPAQDYGLILWSHGTGWLPPGIFDSLKSRKILRSFGKDGNHEIGLIELAASIPASFEFIIFDACLMGSIEVLYQLRNKANTIIASPTETLVAGFPYDKIVPLLFTPVCGYAEIAQEYMSYYKNKTGILQSATIAVVDARQLEILAGMLREVVENNSIMQPDKSFVQQYEIQDLVVFYDLQDYLTQAVQDENSAVALKQQIARVVKYHDFTPYFLEELSIERSSGVGVYVSPSIDDDLDEHYKQLDWYIDSKLLCFW